MGKITNGFFKTAAELAGKKEELASIVNKSIFTRDAKKFIAGDKSNLTFAQESVNFLEYLHTSEKMCLVMRLLISEYPEAESKLQEYLRSNGGQEDTSMFKDMLAEYNIDSNLFHEKKSEWNNESDKDEEGWDGDEDLNDEDFEAEENSDDKDDEDCKPITEVGTKIVTSNWDGITINPTDKKEYKRLQERLRYALNKGKETSESYNEKMKVLKTLYGVK